MTLITHLIDNSIWQNLVETANCQVILILSGHKCPVKFWIAGHFVRLFWIVMISTAIIDGYYVIMFINGYVAWAP